MRVWRTKDIATRFVRSLDVIDVAAFALE